MDADAAGGGSRPGLSQDDQGQVGRAGAPDSGHRRKEPRPRPWPGRQRQNLSGHSQGGRGAGGGQGGAHRSVTSRRGSRRVARIPARGARRQAGALSSPPLRRPFRPPFDEACPSLDHGGRDRDRAGRLHARTNAQQRLRRHRRGPELHLRPAKDASDPPRMELDHGGDRRSEPVGPLARTVGPGRRGG